MDQLKANQIQMSIGFTNSIVKPLYEMLAMLFPMSQVFVDLLIDNGRNWINLLQVKIPADELAQLHKDSKEDGLNKIRKFSFAAGTVDIPNDGLSNWSKMTYTSTSSRKFSVVSGRKVSMFKPGGSVRRPFGSEQIQVTEGSRYAQLIKRPISGSELPEISMSPLSSDFTELAITAEE